MVAAPELVRLEKERDLFRRLLELSVLDEPEALLDDALALVAELTLAERAYVELRLRAGAGEVPVLQRARGFLDDELGAVRAAISSGIVAEALASGRSVSTASAVEDPRFRGNSSVLAGTIRAVLCAPLASPEGYVGVVYLQGRPSPGPFTEADRDATELFAKHLGPVAARLARGALESRALDHTVELRRRLPASSIAGRSRALAAVLRQVLVAAPVPFATLLTGESGTGKTALARALHDASPRARGPFVEVSAANLPEALVESELFGAEKGAHSTALRRIEGKVDAARGGTLFLDEVGELPLAVQAKLLTFLQSRRYYRLGGSQALEADVRVVAATNRDLPSMVRERAFREDLFYRLNVLEIRVPPLRERPEDVGPIALAVMARLAEHHGGAARLSPGALAALEVAEWPGNVRQLENVLARGLATALADGEAGELVVTAAHLFPERAPEPTQGAAALSYQEAMRLHQGRVVREALDACQGNVSEAARRLGLARSHLHDLMKAHGITRPRR
jgi:Nif-specific regulatory protein